MTNFLLIIILAVLLLSFGNKLPGSIGKFFADVDKRIEKVVSSASTSGTSESKRSGGDASGDHSKR